MRLNIEFGCISGYNFNENHDGGERMRCDNCDFDSCIKCSQFSVFNEIHRKAYEEENE